jgi:putative phosphoribosyl transferase
MTTEARTRIIDIVGGTADLHGRLVIPDGARGIAVLCHGGARSRHESHHQFIADELVARGLGTLMIDLLTASEQQADLGEGGLRFDIALLVQRLEAVTDWLRLDPQTRMLMIGFFAAGTASAAALRLAATRPGIIRAVVSCGGRPDLAGTELSRLTTPTLLVVGELDLGVVGLNEAAARSLGGVGEVAAVSGATHLFDEPGALEEVADLTVWWFSRFLSGQVEGFAAPAAISPR